MARELPDITGYTTDAMTIAYLQRKVSAGSDMRRAIERVLEDPKVKIHSRRRRKLRKVLEAWCNA